MEAAFTQLRDSRLSIVAACALTGRSRATHYRRGRTTTTTTTTTSSSSSGGGGSGAEDRRPRRPPPSTITEAERERILALLNSERYWDLAIPQVWARELDEGRYWCSQSSMYRIARVAGQVRERRAQATHPPRARPELVARGPSEVWS
jgi:putative transposase